MLVLSLLEPSPLHCAIKCGPPPFGADFSPTRAQRCRPFLLHIRLSESSLLALGFFLLTSLQARADHPPFPAQVAAISNAQSVAGHLGRALAPPSAGKRATCRPSCLQCRHPATGSAGVAGPRALLMPGPAPRQIRPRPPGPAKAS
jgi:hypothetical protein